MHGSKSRDRRIKEAPQPPAMILEPKPKRSSITRLMSATHETSILIKGVCTRRERRQRIFSISPAVCSRLNMSSTKKKEKKGGRVGGRRRGFTVRYTTWIPSGNDGWRSRHFLHFFSPSSPFLSLSRLLPRARRGKQLGS